MPLRRAGLTLIEVLAASVLLGSLLATAVVSASRHTQQVRGAQDRLNALEVADELLHSWLVDGQGNIESNEGPVPDHDGWTWRVYGRTEPELEPLGFHVGVLQIIDQTRQQRMSGDSAARILAEVEFVSSSAVTAPRGF